jgi:electron transport complex protein RnfB
MTALITLAIIGAILGLILAVASEVFYVKADERLVQVEELLPGFNCGACGQPGCSGMAQKLLDNEINLSACKPAKKEDLEEIKEYLASGKDGETVTVKM